MPMPFPKRPAAPTAPAAARATAKAATEEQPPVDWGDEVTPGADFKTLEKGLGSFEVKAFARKRKAMGDLGMCNVAALTLLLTNAESGEETTIDENLPLHPKTMFKVFQFFAAIGQRKHGQKEAFVPDWNAIQGAQGYCLIGVRSWISKKDQSEVFANQIERYLTEEDYSEEAAKSTF